MSGQAYQKKCSLWERLNRLLRILVMGSLNLSLIKVKITDPLKTKALLRVMTLLKMILLSPNLLIRFENLLIPSTDVEMTLPLRILMIIHWHTIQYI